MGGLGLIRVARPMVLVSAVVTLLAALFVCLGGGDRPGAGQDEPRRITLAAVATEYTCPYDHGDCALFPHLTPAVLTAPPLDPPRQPDGLAWLTQAYAVDRPERIGVRARAPDLHVLQVLRT
ncbi:hypothetical protein AB0A69_01915 [Streptomyces sp. NPDC045431]|uniref:hypothetical protein n=1 Tax=Streptomyces sp. NPDC045431 TaxID=3155613 RepID=UPI0033D6C6D7